MPRAVNTTTTADLNSYFLETSLWPAIVYTIILMLTGTVGNILVIYVYRRQFRRSVTRMFIYALSLLDLGNCLITMPAELMILIQFATFPSPLWCKASRYLTYTFNGTSSIILITIALDRYFKVCWPTKSGITLKRAEYICLGAFAFTAIISMPALFLYGEMILPILVTNDEMVILPLRNGYSNGTSRKFSYRTLVSNGSTIPGTSPSLLIYGKFCLLDQEQMDSNLPMLFYVSMFVMYLMMVILVVFFYSNVARAMFKLTSKHAQMFTFYGYHTSTPASNSLLPEPHGGNVYFQRPESKIAINAGRKELSSDSISQSGNKVINENNRTQFPETANKKSHDSICETGYNTGLTVSSKDLVDNIGHVSDHETCSNASEQKCSSREMKPISPTSPRSQSLNNVENLSRITSPDLLNVASLVKKGSSKKKSVKLPKIKVQEASVKCSDSNSQAFPITLYTNNLLLRRIKSAENVHAIARLNKLQVPTGRSRRAKLPDKNDPGISFQKNSSRPETATGIGNVSKSSTQLNVIDKEKTLTLTKTSPKGSRKLCVLPLTGLSSKTAVQVQAVGEDPALTSSHKSLDLIQVQHLSQAVLDITKEGSYVNGSARNLSCSDLLHSEVTLRQKSPEMEMCEKKISAKPAGSKNSLSDKATPRKVVLSTADILQESHRKRSLHPIRTSRMLAIISVFFVISFLPFFIIVLTRATVGSAFLTELNDWELAFVCVFIRSSLISNAVNPIVYGLLSSYFRRECTGIMCCIFRR